MFLKIKFAVKNLSYTFLNLIYNQKCLICGCAKTDELLCKNCAKDVHYLSGFPHKIFQNVPFYSAVLYEGNVRKLIHKLKFTHHKKAAIPLCRILFEYFEKIKENRDYIIIYPPSFYLKSAFRGYNHMHLIAENFSKLSKIEINTNVLKKIKYTKPQYKVRNRRKNIEGSFQINKNEIENLRNKTVLLIDDIITSGATLEEIITCLKKENIDNIICLTIAKSVSNYISKGKNKPV